MAAHLQADNSLLLTSEPDGAFELLIPGDVVGAKREAQIAAFWAAHPCPPDPKEAVREAVADKLGISLEELKAALAS